MLFDVAALVLTSAAVQPAAEAFGVPASSLTVAEAPPYNLVSADFGRIGTGPIGTGVIGTGVTGAPINPAALSHSSSVTSVVVGRSGVESLRSLSGVTLMQALSALPRDQIAQYVSTNPKQMSKLLTAVQGNAQMATFWSTLTHSQAKNLIEGAPRVVGSAEALPANVRDQANRIWIQRSSASLSQKLTGINGRAEAQTAEHQLHMIGEVQQALVTKKNQAPRSLLSVDPNGRGKASIVIGNLQTADYVTYMVPGMFFTVDGQIKDWTDDASRLYTEENQWLARLQKANPDQPKKTVAVVAWMGYQTPDLTNIGSLDLAYQGRDALAASVEGMQASRDGNEPYTTIVAHSYGSTAALMALTEYDFSVNALVLVGCPGSAAQSVKDLHVKNANVWVGAAAWDPVPNSAWFGSDPSSPSYGAKKMDVAGGTDPATGDKLAGSIGHNDYFAANTESVRNMALISINEKSLVTTGAASDVSKTLADAR